MDISIDLISGPGLTSEKDVIGRPAAEREQETTRKGREANC